MSTGTSIPRRTVRLAWAADVATIADIQARAFRDRLPGALSGAVATAELQAAWRAAVSRPPTARHRVLVAAESADPLSGLSGASDGPELIAGPELSVGGGAVVGFAATGPAGDPDAVPGADGEVLALHTALADEALLAALLTAAADTLEADGFGRAQLWVAADDDRLRRVADSAGWLPDGAHRRLAADPTDGAEQAGLELAQIRLHIGLAGDDAAADPPVTDLPVTGPPISDPPTPG